jgi:hypothetical protein
MSVVLLGRNRFEECDSILSYQGQSLVKVVFDPLRVDFSTPHSLPSQRIVRVDKNAVFPSDHVRVVATPQSFAVFWDDSALIIATLMGPGTAHLKMDLRPLGIAVYDDADGLHIGKNVFSGNVARRSATAISLA